jgi:cation transport ATPase
MKALRTLLLLLALLASARASFAQVEKVAVRTTGISCGTCAAVSEIYLRRLAGVDRITISLSTEAILVSYKPGATFQPKDIRDALKRIDVGVLQFQISARGRVRDEGGHRVFVAGKDRFALAAAADAPQVPTDTAVLIEATVNDQADPMELKLMTVKTINSTQPTSTR